MSAGRLTVQQMGRFSGLSSLADCVAKAKPELAANAMRCATNRSAYLLRRQVESQGRGFLKHGGFASAAMRGASADAEREAVGQVGPVRQTESWSEPMKLDTTHTPADAAALRKRAEEQAGTREPPSLSVQTPAEIQQMLHELRVHQIELEMQNEELRRARAELEASRARYFDLYDLAPVGHVTVSEKGMILEANITAATLLGRNRCELNKQLLTRFILKEDQELYYMHRRRLFETGSPQACELRLMKPDGTVCWTRLEATAAEGPDGAPACRVVLSDITERKQAEASLKQIEWMVSNQATPDRVGQTEDHDQGYGDLTELNRDGLIRTSIGSMIETKPSEAALRESAEKYRVLFNSFPLGITISDPSGKIMESNARAAELLGIRKDEHEARRIDGEQWRIIRPDGTPMPAEEYAGVVALKENRLVENVELGVVKPDAEITWLNVTAAPLLLENYGVVITYNDITERKQAEEALKNREYLLNKVFDVLPIGLWFADEKGRLIRGNPAGVKIWGAEPTVPIEEYGVFKARHLPSGKEITPDDWALAHTIRNGVTIEAELLEIDAFDGRKKIILNYTAPVLDDQGKIQGAIVVNHDITEREHLHAQLQQAQKMESVGRLAGGVAHDFNNMLAVILGYTEIAMDQVDPAQPLFAALQEIRKAAERSADLTRQLLAFARKQTIAPRVLDLNETVDGMLKMLRRLIGEDIDLVWKPGRNLGPVRVDPSQVHQLLANLCVNARDAIPGVGKVTIETDVAAFDEAWCATHTGVVPGEYVLLAFSDNGCGMDQETLGHLFEPFFTTKGVGKGTGLGLATVYGMVQQNNGFINVYSKPGQGTTFKVYLPRHATQTAPLSETAPGRSAERGDETILLVEDEPAILKMATMMLESLGYTVVGARTPGEAIRLAEAHAGGIHLLVTDVVMPERNGRDLAEHLLSLHANLKCLFMSGYTADVIALQGVLAAGVQFIQKPFSLKDLAAKVRQALGDEQRKE
jgi:four helix bundle suffix protein